ncbi:MAG: pyridoxine 5'-phosphate synthase, partial [Pseudomonadales bacterium]
MELSVNLNKVALVRNSRGGDVPDVAEAARVVIANGAYGITVHPRPDQRHIIPSDVLRLSALLREEYPRIEFNIEGNPFSDANDTGYPGYVALVEQTRPHQCTLVPDGDDQLTSDHGWDLTVDSNRVAAIIDALKALGGRVSLFMDTDHHQIELAKHVGADRIELYTGPFAEDFHIDGPGGPRTQASFEEYREAARFATSLGLGVNAGHDLDLANLPLFGRITEVKEVSIGHALISDALMMGLAASVAAYHRTLLEAAV